MGRYMTVVKCRVHENKKVEAKILIVRLLTIQGLRWRRQELKGAMGSRFFQISSEKY